MAIEIERKFLVTGADWRSDVRAEETIRQGYLATEPGCSVRIRATQRQAWINIKSATPGMRRTEFEYEIPAADAAELLERFCRRPLVEKTRYRVEVSSHEWEIDVFHGDNAGLVVAEIELGDEHESFVKPGWLGREVTAERRYYNVSLVEHPYCLWRESARG